MAPGAGNNILLDPLPHAVTVEGREIPIRADYRTGIRFEQLIWDRQISEKERVIRGLLLFFDRADLPATTEGVMAAYDAALWFYRLGEELPKKPEKPVTGDEAPAQRPGKRPPKRLIDYGQDAQYIYAAYLDQYGIDLQEAKDLHWWKFRTLFAGLREDHMIMKIIGYRAAVPSTIKNKTERARIQRLQALYSIRDDLTAEERADRAGDIFGGAL